MTWCVPSGLESLFRKSQSKLDGRAMRPDELLRLIWARPFRPFRLHLTNGDSHEIRHPEMASVDRSIVWVHYPAKTLPLAIAERRLFIVLIHIVFGEYIEPAAKPGGNGAGT